MIALSEGKSQGCGTQIWERSSGGANLLKNQVGLTHFLWEMKVNVFEFEDLCASEVSVNLDRPDGKNKRSFLVIKERGD